MAFSIRNLIDLTVPQYLMIILISPLSAYLIINQKIPSFSFIWIIISMCFGVLGFNSLNMVFDSKTDKLDKPKRPIPSGKVTIKEATIISSILYVLSIGTSLMVNQLFTTIILLFILISALYSLPFIYLKKYWWGSSFVGTILYGILPFLSAVSISQPGTHIPIIFIIYFASLFTIISNVKDIEDTVGEEKNKINSLPLLIGSENTTYLIIIAPLILTILMGVLALTEIIPQKFLIASIFSSIIIILFANTIWKETKKINYQNILFKELKNERVKEIVTQSNAVTLTVLNALIIQLTFGITAMI